MRSAHTVEQVRSAEAALMASAPGGDADAGAAAGLAAAVVDLLGSAYGRRVRLLVGSGDNGGDALYAGALLARRGCHVDAVLLGEAASGGSGRTPAGRRQGRHAPRARPDVVVDGIVGIGGRPGLRAGGGAALAAVDGAPIVAVDMPSGVSRRHRRARRAHVQAAVTVTFGTHKVAHLVDPPARPAARSTWSTSGSTCRPRP